MHAARFIVSGRVQGVFYRAGTREQASNLGLSGHAKNLPGGDVEVLAVGGIAALNALEQWLQLGPPAARVTSVIREDLAEKSIAGSHVTSFQIR